MKTGIIIGVVIGIIAIGVLAYYMYGTDDQVMSEEISDQLDDDMISEGKDLSINLKESVGVEANP